MGVLDRFERGIERAVNGAFAKAFRSEVQPVEIASAVRREMDDHAAVVARGRTLVPNNFTVELGDTDHERLSSWQEALADELAQNAQEHADQQRYTFVGPVRVQFDHADDLSTGALRVRSATVKGRVAPQVPPSQQSPARRPTAAPTIEVDGRTFGLQRVTVVGRGSEADIVLDDPGISRRHLEIRVGQPDVDGRVAVHANDLGSTNGMFVDGERVQSRRLVDGSVITVGRSRLVVRVPGR